MRRSEVQWDDFAMPQTLRFHLSGAPARGPFQHGKGLHALVVGGWLASADPDIATHVHDANQLGPLTISPLLPQRAGDGGPGCYFEVGVLSDWLADPLIAGMQVTPETIRLGPQTFRLTGWEVAAAATWDDLRAPAPPGWKQFGCELVTPTAHHQRYPFRKGLVLPSPELYIGSWLERWNLCCEEPFDDGALRQVAQDRVAISAASGATRAVPLDPGRLFIGWEGQVRFALLGPDTFPDEERNALAALVRFARFAGTGVETIRGMGQTRPGGGAAL
jgi:hypothetical protein